MQQYNKTRGIRGIVAAHNDALRFRDMITNSAQERVRILIFWKKHGDEAEKEALSISMPIQELQKCKVKLKGSIAPFQKLLFQETGIFLLMILMNSTDGLWNGFSGTIRDVLTGRLA